MNKGTDNALEKYYQMYDKCRNVEGGIHMEDIYCLLEQMKMELLVKGNSSLLNAAYTLWFNYFNSSKFAFWELAVEYCPRSYTLNVSRKGYNIAFFDAWQIIYMLPLYFKEENIENHIQYVARNLCKGMTLRDPDARKFVSTMEAIDEAVEKNREILFGEKRTQSNIMVAEVQSLSGIREKAEQEAERIMKNAKEAAEKLKSDAQQEADKITNEAVKIAEQEAKRTADQIREDAVNEARKIVENAREHAKDLLKSSGNVVDKKMTSARKRAMELTHCPRIKQFEEEKALYSGNFSLIQQSLVQVNEMMRRVEDEISESATKKAFHNLSELYHLIADIKTSERALAEKTGNVDLENSAYNLEVFLDMISEYLEDYGIKTILTEAGEHFNVTYHEVVKGRNYWSYDPKTAIVTKSVRCGFVWGEQVLQKEIVEINY